MDETNSTTSQSQRELARLREENEALRAQLGDAQETLRAIREGEVDALVVSTPAGERIFTLQGGDHPYRALIEQMREGAATLTPNGVIHYCNGRFAEMLGLPLERVMGGRMEEFVAPADRAALVAMLTDGTQRRELTLLTADATEIPVLASAISLQAEGPAAICLVVADLTERKRHEAEIQQLNKELDERVVQRTAQLAAARDLLAVTVASIGDGVIVTDPQGRVTFLNAEAERLTGWTSREAEGRPLPAVFHIINEHTRQPLENPVEKVFRLGTVVGLANHTILIAKDGTETPIDDSGAPIRQSGGTVQGVVVVFRDITEKRKAERSVARLAAIVAYSNDAIVSKDLNGIIQTWNAGAERLFGYRADEIIGRPISLLLPADRTWEEDRILEHLRSGQYVEHRDTVRLTKDGRPIDVSVTVSPIKDQDGRIIGASKVARDITDRKRAQEELQAAKESADRAKAAAEHANRAKDHFLAVLSHELRTPLTPVVMGVSMLQERPDLDPGMREMLDTFRRNIEMEVGLIDDLLDVTRIARGKIELNRSPVELGTVIQRAVEVCKPDIEARGLNFGVDLGPSAPYWVEVDIPRLQQVFWNLLRNAVKFTPQGGCVGIRCRPDETHVVVEVHDSGIGIEPEALPRVFNAFEQVERSITQQFGGLGLGLAISKALVEMHGGGIEAHSEGRGKGAMFRVRLPLTAPAGALAAPPRATPPRRPVRPLRVLLVEDHGVTAKMMRMMLSADGHSVETAGDVSAALQLADRQAFDVLVSDLGLPDGSGHDLMRELRSRGHKFSAIALSGYGQAEDIRRSLETGFAAHLTKPTSRDALLDAVASVTATEIPAGTGLDRPSDR